MCKVGSIQIKICSDLLASDVEKKIFHEKKLH